MAGMGFLKRLLSSATPGQVEQTWRKTTHGARILVVDDSATIRAVLGRMLEVEGYEVVRAADGETALEMARAEPPAMIFLDIVLPGMNGFAVLRALRHDPATQHVPIVMISGNQQATDDDEEGNTDQDDSKHGHRHAGAELQRPNHPPRPPRRVYLRGVALSPRRLLRHT